MVLLEPVMVQPIGIVRNNLGRRGYDEWRDTESDVVVCEEYQEALLGLDEYSHIEVLFYLHKMDKPFNARIHPTGNPVYPLVGVFATRTPNRPSRLALTTCRLLSINGNVVRVRGLDAYDGSPVLDIKPHFGLKSNEVKVPNWVKELDQGIR
jgi:tRNA-Thr(GGU) m(6)t(6)A37 methyltransferase TsaA